MNRAGNQQYGKGQGRGRRMCRNREEDTGFSAKSDRKGMGLFCKRFGDNAWQAEQLLDAEAVVGEDKRSYDSNLQMLKEQASKLVQALKNIEAQIKSLEAEK